MAYRKWAWVGSSVERAAVPNSRSALLQHRRRCSGGSNWHSGRAARVFEALFAVGRAQLAQSLGRLWAGRAGSATDA